jgi:hypothetical protein
MNLHSVNVLSLSSEGKQKLLPQSLPLLPLLILILILILSISASKRRSRAGVVVLKISFGGAGDAGQLD